MPLSSIYLPDNSYHTESLDMEVDYVFDKASCYRWTFINLMVKSHIFTRILNERFMLKINIFSVLVYYLRSKSMARIAMVKLLKDMLYLEAKDKEFLLTNITRVTQGKGKEMFGLFIFM